MNVTGFFKNENVGIFDDFGEDSREEKTVMRMKE
jgi:hypothetical protein